MLKVLRWPKRPRAILAAMAAELRRAGLDLIGRPEAASRTEEPTDTRMEGGLAEVVDRCQVVGEEDISRRETGEEPGGEGGVRATRDFWEYQNI